MSAAVQGRQLRMAAEGQHSFRLIAVFLVLVLTLAGCNSSQIYQDDRYNPPVYWGQHVVKQGETLYSIAWRYGRDYRELGNANGLEPPYHLNVGQVIRLDLKGQIPQQAVSKAPPPDRSVSPPSRASSKRSRSEPDPAPTRSSKPSSQSQPSGPVRWQWPGSGTVIAGFSTSGKVNKGIDLDGDAGDPVYAAARGNVVYAGNGLLGYGNLIIVNHNEHFLSAYAHNRTMLVSEGEDVAAGQKIAEVGSTGTNRNKLHFEIRKDGEPVDPQRYLPDR